MLCYQCYRRYCVGVYSFSFLSKILFLGIMFIMRVLNILTFEVLYCNCACLKWKSDLGKKIVSIV